MSTNLRKKIRRIVCNVPLKRLLFLLKTQISLNIYNFSCVVTATVLTLRSNIRNKKKTMARIDTEEKVNVRFCCCCFPKQASFNEDINQSLLALGPKPELALPLSYTEDLPEQLSTGSIIHIKGFVQPDCIRFAVNLTTTNGPDADIPLHFNPRLDRHYIVRNTRKRGRWDEEETTSAVKSNIERNKNFDIVIFVATTDFLISVNDVHFCAFTFRFPLNLCKRIEIEGLVDVLAVNYDKWNVYPNVGLEKLPKVIFSGERENDTCLLSLPVPYTGHLPKGFEEGWQLEISGRVKLLPHSFYINLQDGAQLWPHPIIFLHLNPRFNTSAGENVFIRNARFGGQWGTEERSRMFQFSPGSPFTIAIRRGFERFSIWVDGQLSGEFKIGGTPSTLNTVYVQGDIVLKEIVMHNKYIDYINE